MTFFTISLSGCFTAYMSDCQRESGNKDSLCHTDEPVERKRRYVNIMILKMPVILK